MRSLRTACLLWLAAGLGHTTAAPWPDSIQSFERIAFGTRVTLDVEASSARESALNEVVRAVFERCAELEALTNAWSAESALCRWNAEWEPRPADSAGPSEAAPIERSVPAPLAPLIATALAFAKRSDGAFDPSVGAVLADLGFYGGPPLASAVDAVRVRSWKNRVGYRRLALQYEREAGRAFVRTDLDRPRLDLSGLIKGVAAGEARRLLRAAGFESARIAVGASTICAWGPGREGRGWPVALPGAAGTTTWWLRDETLSTSGRLAHTLEAGGESFSHLIDPRTCRPVDHRTAMVAVVVGDPTVADMLSTALLVMGVAEGRAWVETRAPASWTAVFWSTPENDDPRTAPRPQIVVCGRRR